MTFKNPYWSCSKFSDWLRGTPKLDVGTSEEWSDWRKLAKSAHPVRYWIAEEGLDLVQDFATWPIRKIYDVKYYINNRFITKTHALTAHRRDIKPGTWQDVGNRFLPCLFNELQDFVEVELAWSHVVWDPVARKEFQAPFYATGWFRWRTWRCPQAGLDNLDWRRSLRWTENELGPDHSDIGTRTPQALHAEEILALYKWWTEIYRNRPDPMDASGWTDYCARTRNGDDDFLFQPTDEATMKQRDRAIDLCNEIEQQYEQEDEEMLIRLIRIRNSLWT